MLRISARQCGTRERERETERERERDEWLDLCVGFLSFDIK